MEPEREHKGSTLESLTLWHISELEDELKLSVLLDHQHHEHGNGDEDLLRNDQRLNKLVFSIVSDIKESDKPNVNVIFEEFVINQILYSIRFLVDHIVSSKTNNVNANKVSHESLSNTDDEDEPVHLRPIQLTLERLFIWHSVNSDVDDFKDVSKKEVKTSSSPFFTLIYGLMKLCEQHSLIGRRVVTEFIHGLTQDTIEQVAKFCFLVGSKAESAAIRLLQPVETFISKICWTSSVIDNVLKPTTKTDLFWTNWAYYIVQSTTRLNIWNQVMKAYSGLCSNVNSGFVAPQLIPATYCLIALGRECLNGGYITGLTQSEQKLQEQQLITFQELLGLLDQSNNELKCCAAISCKLVRVMLDEIGSEYESDASDGPKFDLLVLFFDKLYFRLLCFFYEDDNNPTSGPTKNINLNHPNPAIMVKEKVNVYDGMSLNFTAKAKAWIIHTFTDVLELLVLSPVGLSHPEVTLLRKKALLRIPVLVQNGLGLDFIIAANIVRLINEHAFASDMDFPLTLALTKLAHLQPKCVCQTLGQMCFNSYTYSIEQRTNYLRSYLQMVQLLSGRKCLECFYNRKHKRLWRQLDSPFRKYLQYERSVSKKCVNCRRDVVIYNHVLELNSVELFQPRFGAGRVVPLESEEHSSVLKFSSICQHLWTPIWNNLCRFPAANTSISINGLVSNYLKLATQVLYEIFSGTSPRDVFLVVVAPQVAHLVIAFTKSENPHPEPTLIVLHLFLFYLTHVRGNVTALHALRSTVDVFQYLMDYYASAAAGAGEMNEAVKELIKSIIQAAVMSHVEDKGGSLRRFLKSVKKENKSVEFRLTETVKKFPSLFNQDSIFLQVLTELNSTKRTSFHFVKIF